MLLRSFFFAPANRPDLVLKFPRFQADLSVIDLEDGTPPAEKAKARAALTKTVADLRAAGFRGQLCVRVNVPDSPHYLADIQAAFAADVDGIVIPKLEEAAQAYPALYTMRQLDIEQPRARPRYIVGGIESVRGVLQALRICTETDALAAVYFGAEDYAADIGGRRTLLGDEVYTARSMVVMAAHAGQVPALDQAVVDIRNDELFMQDASRGRDLGYVGKICVTPGQVKLANTAFSPSPEERERAQRLVAAYTAAMAQGLGTIDFEGQMIDGPLLKRAEAILAAPQG